MDYERQIWSLIHFQHLNDFQIITIILVNQKTSIRKPALEENGRANEWQSYEFYNDISPLEIRN